MVLFLLDRKIYLKMVCDILLPRELYSSTFCLSNLCAKDIVKCLAVRAHEPSQSVGFSIKLTRGKNY